MNHKKNEKYYIYETSNGLAGVSVSEKNLPLIGVADTTEKAEEILKNFITEKFSG